VDAPTLNQFDVIISISARSNMWRQAGVTRPLILWTGHDVDQDAVQSLSDYTERLLFDKIVMVSNWQASRYSTTFNIKPEQIAVLRYAIAPAFEVPRSKHYFFATRRPPVLLYSSAPFRGLDVLLRAFPTIRTLVPGCEALICSSMNVYQVPAEQDTYRHLYDRCRRTEGMHYFGSIGQAGLAQKMGGIDVFAYPSTFPETSCIALMEAMAGGCMILTSALGALPETAAGFGSHCELPREPERSAEFYARFVAQAILEAYNSPHRSAAQIDEQRAFALKNYCWSERAAEWEKLLDTVLHQPIRSIVPRRNEPCLCGSGRKFKHCCGSAI